MPDSHIDPKFFPFRRHPLLSKIEECFRLKNIDDTLIDILKNNVVFIYPKIFVFSFKRYPDQLNNVKYQSFFSREEYDESKVFLSEGDTQEHDFIASTIYLSFFECLISSFRSLEIDPILIIDLRDIRLFDEQLVVKISSYFDHSDKLILLCSDKASAEFKEISNRIKI